MGKSELDLPATSQIRRRKPASECGTSTKITVLLVCGIQSCWKASGIEKPKIGRTQLKFMGSIVAGAAPGPAAATSRWRDTFESVVTCALLFETGPVFLLPLRWWGQKGFSLVGLGIKRLVTGTR